nr:thermonuclease family protein [Rhizobium ruizarguesonis]
MRTSQTQEFSVTDGDTVHVVGEAAGTRLVGFNTPEKFSPQCEYERQQGERASARLRELVAHGSGRLTKVACACASGTEGTKKCNHGRYCGTLLVDGKDVGSILISEGLAVPFVCGRTSCPPTPRPWCKG